jgi:F-type H+-transporting ATPase subunit epsilon
MDLTILTSHKKLVESETIDELFVPGYLGELNILPMHANFVTKIGTGVVRWRQGTNWKKATVSYGLLEIFDGHVSLLADVSELGSDVDVSRAKKAEEKAKQKLEDGGLDDANFRKYQLKLERAVARVSASH